MSAYFLPLQPVEEKEAAATEEPDFPCGWWFLRASCLQRFRTPKWVLFGLCWAGALQGMVVNGFVNVSITTIERRFGLRSSQTGLIAGAYDIASFICLIPVTYLGGRIGASKPLWLGGGVLVMGLGSFIYAMPHFAVGPYRDGRTSESSLCGLNSTTSTDCFRDESTYDLSLLMWVFFAGHFLHGVGSSPLYTLGVTLIDETVSTKMSSVYLGVFYTMAIVGPALGYALGGHFLSIYTDVMVVDPSQVGLSRDSNVWVGAWWMGFLLTAMLSVVVAIPLAGFPAQFPGAAQLRNQKVSEAHGRMKKDAFSKLSEMPKALRNLLKNPTFFFLNVAAASEGLLVSGFAAFLPKFLENQFGINPTASSLLMGMMTVPAGGGGTYLGGYLVKRMGLKCAGIIKLCVACTFVGACFTFGFLLTCPNLAFAGVTQGFHDNSEMSLNSSCNEPCACTALFDPVCGSDKIMYYSPCHAGCKEESSVGNTKLYTNCSCISTLEDKSAYAKNVNCETDCPNLIPFLVLIFFVMFTTFLCSMPALAATLRCVQDEQRSFALGIQWLKVRLLGTIPAPLLFGALIDRTCILWQESCDDNGACLVFNNQYMSYYMMGLALAGKLVGLTSFFLAWRYYVPPNPTENTCKDTLQQENCRKNEQ